MKRLHCIMLLFVKYIVTFNECAIINEYGQYEDIFVSISPYIPASKLEYAVNELETLFRDSSSFLHSVTNGLFSFKEITFVLPNNLNISSVDKDWISQRKIGHPDSPDIYLLEQGLFQANPYTIQHKGCGEKGLEINLPLEFFSYNQKEKSKNFIHEWIHYRFGIFDEHGFLNDALYPLFYLTLGKDKQELSVTGCTNQKPSYIFIDENSQICQPFKNDCFPIPSGRPENHIIRSSLMHKPFFPETDQLCNDKNVLHNKDAPTKQNALCRERSVWNVIKNHDDFLKKRLNRTGLVPPNFKYVLESKAHLVFAIEATDNLRDKGRIDYIKNAFSYFILYDLPYQSKVTILNMKTSELSSTFTDSERIFNAFPDVYGTDNDVCVECDLMKALKVLESDAEVTSKFIILITTKDIAELESAISALQATTDIKLFVIFFGNAHNSPPLLTKLTTITSGQLFHILEETRYHKLLSPLNIIYEAFRSIYRSLSWFSNNKVLIDQKIFYNNSSENFMHFEVDEGIEILHVIMTGHEFRSDPPIIKDSIKLQLEDRIYYSNEDSFFYKIRIPAYLFIIKSPKVGTWKLQFQKKSTQKYPFEVIIRAAVNDYRDINNARSWISAHKSNVRKPWIIFNRIYKGIHPVIGTSSNAFIFNHLTGIESVLELRDNGNGDPDITKNDGIYSRYLTNAVDKGFHTILIVSKHTQNTEGRIEARGDLDHCCGSQIPTELSANATTFSRLHIYGSVYIGHVIPEKNLAPNRITDLHIINVNTLKNNVKYYTLQWIAPGAYLDYGTVSHYEIKIFRSRTDALLNFENNDVLTIDEWNIHGWLKEKIAGTTQTVNIELRNIETGLYFLAMRAINSYGNSGDVSNVVELYFVKPIEEMSTSIDTSEITSTADPAVSVDDPKLANDADSNTGIVIGVTCGILFLFLVIGIILLVSLSNKRKSNERKKQHISPPYFPRNRPNSNEIKENSRDIDHQIKHCYSTYPKSNLLNAASNNVMSSTLTLSKVQNDNIPIVSRSNSGIFTINDYVNNQMHFYDVPLREEINAPFNPSYTSSLRRLQADGNVSYRLGTDV